MTDHPSGLIIAVVDDDQRVLESLQNLLESADYCVRLFPSAAALLESGCVAEIDCLISDICMPGMDGLELSRAVHATQPYVSIIFITGHADLLNRLPQIGTSAYRFFRKPFDGEALLATVSDALRNSHMP